MQSAFDGRFAIGFGFGFVRLLGHQHLFGRGHHHADGRGLRFGLAAAIAQVSSACGIFFRSCFRGSGGLGQAVQARLFGSGDRLFLGLLRLHLFFRRLNLVTCTAGSRLGRCFAGLRYLALGCSLLGCGALTRFRLFALTAALRQFFFLAAQQLGLASRFFFAAGQLGFIDQRLLRAERLKRLSGTFRAILSADKGALFAHFHLDSARSAGGVSLFDFRGLLFDQRDLLALRRGGAVAALQKRQQLVLVGVGQGIARGGFGHAGGFQLLKQGFSRPLELISELGNSGDGHVVGNLSWPLLVSGCVIGEPMCAGLHDQGVGIVFRLPRDINKFVGREIG